MKQSFKGLASLRAIAALVVVLGHIELIKKTNEISNIYGKLPDGHLGVILFFVLSGFLITFLLVQEKQKNNNISFKKFYLRRILRIWPLYYLIIFLSFVIFQDENYSLKSAILCLTVFPNIAHSLKIGWASSPQLWSIGVEEQFYLFWPLLISVLPSRKIIMYLLLFFVGYTLLPHVIGFINTRTINNVDLFNFNQSFFGSTKFNCMSFGGVLGYMYATKHSFLKILYKPIIAYPAVILPFLLWLFQINFGFFNDEVYSILFGLLILNLATNDNLKISMDNSILKFLGDISYGIYMYHWIVILLIIKLLSSLEIHNLVGYNILLYTLVLIITILISWISFNTFEKYFLNIKKRFEIK